MSGLTVKVNGVKKQSTEKRSLQCKRFIPGEFAWKVILANGAGFCLTLRTKILAVLPAWGQPQIHDFPIKMTWPIFFYCWPIVDPVLKRMPPFKCLFSFFFLFLLEKHTEQALISLLPGVKLGTCWDTQRQNLRVNLHWKLAEKCVEWFLPITCYLAE